MRSFGILRISRFCGTPLNKNINERGIRPDISGLIKFLSFLPEFLILLRDGDLKVRREI